MALNIRRKLKTFNVSFKVTDIHKNISVFTRWLLSLAS